MLALPLEGHVNKSQPALTHLLEISPRAAIWRLALPTSLLGLTQSSYHLANSWWVSFLGDDALAALTSSSFALWGLQALGEICQTGVYSQVAQATGAGDVTRIRQTLGAGLVLLVGIAISTGLGLHLLAPFYLLELGLDPHTQVSQLARDYLQTFAWFTLPWMGLTVTNATFRGLGDAKTPLKVSGATLLLTALLDPLLLMGVGPWPGLGIAGPAVATGIANCCGLVAGLYLLGRRGFTPLLRSAILPQMAGLARLGLPLAMTGLGFNLVYVFLGRVLAPWSPHAMAALGLGHRLESPVYFLSAGLSVAATTLVGQYVGAGRRAEVVGIAKTVAHEGLRWLWPLAALTTLGGSLWLRPFTQDPQVLEWGGSYLFFNGIAQLFMMTELIFEGAFAGAGRTLAPLLISLPLTLLRLPLAWFFADRLGLGPPGVFLAIALSTILKGISLRGWFSRRGNT